LSAPALVPQRQADRRSFRPKGRQARAKLALRARQDGAERVTDPGQRPGWIGGIDSGSRPVWLRSAAGTAQPRPFCNRQLINLNRRKNLLPFKITAAF